MWTFRSSTTSVPSSLGLTRTVSMSERGLGLGLMRSLMDTVRVSPSEDGTEVVLERNVHISSRV